MHLENIHKMIEDLTGCTKSAIESEQTHIGQIPVTDVVDMIKDLAEAEYHCKISKAMDKSEEEKEDEEKYMIQRLKEEYGEDDGQRYYNDWRYANGRFAPKGRGTKRGYAEPRYHMPMDIYEYDYSPEYLRDMDRGTRNVMYYPHASGSDRYDEGYSRGYEEGSRINVRDRREGVSGRRRRSYMETKEAGAEKATKMRELENYMMELGKDVTEMISGASEEEKSMLKSKMQSLMNRI